MSFSEPRVLFENIKIIIGKYKFQFVSKTELNMRLRPLFSPDLNNSMNNKSRSLHNCPSCRCKCQSPKIPQRNMPNIANIYTKGHRLQVPFRQVIKANQISVGNPEHKPVRFVSSQHFLKTDRNLERTGTFKQISNRFVSPRAQGSFTQSFLPKSHVKIRYVSPERERNNFQRIYSQNNITLRPLVSGFSSQNPAQMQSEKNSAYFPIQKQEYSERNQEITSLYYCEGATKNSESEGELPSKPRILSGKKQMFKRSQASDNSQKGYTVNTHTRNSDQKIQSSKSSEQYSESDDQRSGRHERIVMNKNVKGKSQKIQSFNTERNNPFGKFQKSSHEQVRNSQYKSSEEQEIQETGATKNSNEQKQTKNSSQTGNRSEGRFAFYKKKNSQTYEQQHPMQPKSRSRSNQDKQPHKQKTKSLNTPQIIVKHGRESIEMAKEIMHELNLYYDYYEGNKSSEGSSQDK